MTRMAPSGMSYEILLVDVKLLGEIQNIAECPICKFKTIIIGRLFSVLIVYAVIFLIFC